METTNSTQGHKGEFTIIVNGRMKKVTADDSVSFLLTIQATGS